ncbi:hypothetical protein GF342_00805 [Candidatus Woesearchaeota archaeon]|nr:hypothetical protein [Candidatus Woesearchaeota archaeon]
MHEFFPTDITYKVEDGRAVIYLFGRFSNGTQAIVTSNDLQPYFYVEPKEESMSAIAAMRVEEKGEDYFVTRTESVTRTLLGESKKLLKIVVNVPKAVPIIKSALKEHIHDAYEYDLLFTRRFLLDNDITIMTKVKFEGTRKTDVNKVPLYEATRFENVEDTYTAPRILAIDIETYLPQGQRLNMDEQPIIMIGFAGKTFRKVITWKQIKSEHSWLECVTSEAELLARCKDIIEEYAPDIITGYNSDSFDLPFIVKRAKKYKIALDLGLDYSPVSIRGRQHKIASIAGIVHLDLFQFVRRVMRTSLETDVLSLDRVAQELIGKGKTGADVTKLAACWDAEEQLEEYAEYNLADAEITHELCMHILPNMIELVKIVKLPLFDVSRSSFSQLVEWYLIYRAHGENAIAPNKPGYREQQRRAREHVKGAFVYEPKPGLYEEVVVFDYRSLYPSIIASHNICPSTIRCTCCASAPIDTVAGKVWFCQKRKGFISKVIEDLITRRARIKELLRTNKKDSLLYARSIALKLLANSMYGYLGFEFARWYSIGSAGATTGLGRQYVQDVISKAEQEGYGILYGDTDSAMLILGDKTRDEALQFAERINERLPGLMELELEGFYPRALFVATKGSETGAKKKYAMIDDAGEVKIRGFETVRRNWSPIAKNVQKAVLAIILKEGDVHKAILHAKHTIDGIRQHTTPVQELLITTQLQKPLGEYASVGPHVAAAQRLEEQGGTVEPGVFIRYVVIEGKGLIRDKVRLEHEVNKGDYDAEYYVNNQVVPSVERIFLALGYETKDLLMKGTQSTLGEY